MDNLVAAAITNIVALMSVCLMITFGLIALGIFIGSRSDPPRKSRLIPAGLVFFVLSIVLLLSVLTYGVRVNAPTAWFSRLPQQESSFFQQHMKSRHSPISINRFVSMNRRYHLDLRGDAALRVQQDALKTQMHALR